MTLLELLRQELPKRGGWPEGATCAAQDPDKLVMFAACDPKEVRPYGSGYWYMDASRLNGDGSEGYELADDRATAIVTREQYEATGWDGTGLPPVGCECEVLFTDDDFPEWYTFKIVFIGDVHTVAIVGGEEISYAIERLNDSSVQFRPLRTETERAIDEMVRLSGVSIGAAKILYDAGYRKG